MENMNYETWLEDICLRLLAGEKEMTKGVLTAKLDKLGADVNKEFIDRLFDAYDEEMVKDFWVKKLPFLESYPLPLDADIMQEDVEAVYEWELKTVKTLLSELLNSHFDREITAKEYIEFFNEKIMPYSNWLDVINSEDDGYLFDKIKPENVELYWGFRMDKNLDWCDCEIADKIGISIDNILEYDYINKENSMDSFAYKIGDDPAHLQD